MPPRTSRAALLGSYLRLGGLHILTGYDHLLFLLALIYIFPFLVQVANSFKTDEEAFNDVDAYKRNMRNAATGA